MNDEFIPENLKLTSRSSIFETFNCKKKEIMELQMLTDKQFSE